MPDGDTSDAAEQPEDLARLLRRRTRSGAIELRTSGNSMLPVIPTDAVVSVGPADRPRRGEIWAFVDDAGRVVVHRVRRADRSEVTLRGDNNPGNDRRVVIERLIGRVVEVDGRRIGGTHRLRAVLVQAVAGLRRRLRTR